MFNTEKQNNTTDDIIPIYDENDPLEVAVKTRLNGDTYYKSMNEIYRLIGLEELGISLAGGKQKKKADKILAQYLIFRKEKDRVYVESFWKVPKYIPSVNNRGKRGFYVDRVPLILLRYLTLYARRTSVAMKEDFHYSATVNDLAIGLKIVKSDFKWLQKDKIEGFPGIKPYWVNHFYYKCKESLNSIIKSSLQKLQSLNALDFEDIYILVHNKEHTEADQETATCIDNVINEMLKDYGYKNRAEIHLKGRSKDFYTDVTNEVNERCASKIGFEIESYYQRIKILTSPDRMARVAHSHFDVPYFFDSLFHENYQIYQKEVNQHFVEAMKKKFEHNYQNAKEKYDQWLLNEREDNKSMRGASPEVFSLHKYLRACAIPEAREPYRYPKTYLETQSELIDRFIVWA